MIPRQCPQEPKTSGGTGRSTERRAGQLEARRGKASPEMGQEMSRQQVGAIPLAEVELGSLASLLGLLASSMHMLAWAIVAT